MRFSSAGIYRYDVPFVRTLNVKGHLLDGRSGLIVKVANEDGQTGLGEIAPLPGLNEETLEEATAQTVELIQTLEGREITPELAELRGEFAEWLDDVSLLPSVRFGIEMALLNLLAACEKVPLARLLSGAPAAWVSINGLLDGAAEDMLAKAERLANGGYTAVKLKVARKAVEEDIAIVQEVSRIVGPSVELRLDANRTWDYPTAMAFGHAVADCRIEYLEEPLRDPHRLGELVKATGLPVALDETLRDYPELMTETDPPIKAILLKLPRLGGFEAVLHLIRQASRLGIYPVVSSSFESGFTLAMLTNLAAAVHPDGVPAGLDTNAWFAQDVLRQRTEVQNGKLELAQVNAATETIDLDALEVIHRG